MRKKKQNDTSRAKKQDIFEKELSGKTAIFIDAANLEKSVADLGTKPPKIKKLKKGFFWKALPKGYYKVDYKKLYTFFKTNAKLASISFYSARFETQAHDDFLTFLKRNGYRLVTKRIKEINAGTPTRTRKANFDVEISVDAVSWIKNYNTCVLFSGDSDFNYLIRFLKKNKKRIVVISERWHVSRELVRAADFYHDLHFFKNEFVVLRKQKSRR